MDNVDQFLNDMRKLSDNIVDYDDAFAYAIEHAQCFLYSWSVFYFGRIGDGYVYISEEYKDSYWFPKTDGYDAIQSLLSIEEARESANHILSEYVKGEVS